MKKTLILATAVIMLLCSFDLKNLFGSKATSTASTPAPATVAATATTATNAEGKAAGAALKALYSQYKADGKFDYSNPNNILNTISLLDNCKQLKSNAKDGEYWKSFASGLILGSENLVTEDLANGVTEQLNTMMENIDTTKLEKAKSNTMAAAGTVATCATSVNNLLSLFKK
ncbi:MAG: hypothetical protein MJZ88_05175 [Paludibacteraceae bacterium]|nr:hypothetical protein [Paludibacteraceae bacterium]